MKQNQMKRISFVLLTFLFAAACEQMPTDGPGVDPQPTVVEILDVSFDDDPSGTKATVHPFTGKVNPSAGDQVAVYFTGSGFENADITADQKVQVSGSGTRAKFAVFPATAKNYFNLNPVVLSDKDYYKISYPEELDYSDKPHDYVLPPMIAVNDANLSGLRFFHVGGVIRFKLYAIPAGTQYIKVTSISKENPQVFRPISGDVPILFDNNIFNGNAPVTSAPVPLRAFSTDQDTKAIYDSHYASGLRDYVLIKISASPLASETDGLVINLPVPISTYESFQIDALDSNKNPLTTGDYAVIDQEINWDCERTLGLKLGRALAFVPNHPITNPNYIPGLFTVSESGKQVWFASGNLVVTYKSGGQHEWAFEENQWGYSFGNDVSYSNYGGSNDYGSMTNYKTNGTPISHFGWATAGVQNGSNAYGYDANHTRFYPHNIESSSKSSLIEGKGNYYGYGPSQFTTDPYNWAADLPVGTGFDNTWNRDGLSTVTNSVRMYCDWGVHFDDLGEGSQDNTSGTWYTHRRVQEGHPPGQGCTRRPFRQRPGHPPPGGGSRLVRRPDPA